jgi:hypothetical protein
MKIENIKPYKSLNLKVGDLFFGEKEFTNGKYSDTDRKETEVGFLNESDCNVEKKYMEVMPSKMKLFTFERMMNLKNIDESRKSGIWLVVDLTYNKEFKGLHGVMHERLKITAEKIVEGKKTNEFISFHTIGGKNLIDKKFEIIGKIIK